MYKEFVVEVKRFEEDRNQVLLYFTKLANEQVCAPFIISESNKIEDPSNSTVKIYDYYKPEFEASEVNCSHNQDLAFTKYLQVYKINGCVESGAPIPQLNVNATILPETEPSNYISVTRTRSVNMTGLNPDFVNMDVEMATPGGKKSGLCEFILRKHIAGMEGNFPVYTPPDDSKNRRKHVD